MRRYIAMILTITVFTMCVFNLHVGHAHASGADNELYLDTLFETFYSRYPNQTSTLDSLKLSLKTYINPDNNYLVCALEDNGTYLISVYYSANKSQRLWYSVDYYDRWGSRYDGISRVASPSDYFESNWWRMLYIWATPTTLESSTYEYNGMGVGAYPMTFNFSNPNYWAYQAYPSKGNMDSYNVYCNRDILQGSGSFAFPANFFDGEAIIRFELVVFWLGEKRYLTTGDQLFMSRLDPDKIYYSMHIGTDVDANLYTFFWEDVINVGHVENFINYTFDNVSEYGIYAFDITNIVGDYIDFCQETIMDMNTGNTSVGAVADNIPLRISREGGESNVYTDVWNFWNEYVNNYPTQGVTPQSLSLNLFGTHETRIYPCTVQIPSTLMQKRDGTVPTPPAYNANVDTFAWDYTYDFNDAIFNYDLMDVCILAIPYTDSFLTSVLPYNLKFNVVYFMSNTVTDNNTVLGTFTLAEIYDRFDLIIAIPFTNSSLNSGYNIYPFASDGKVGTLLDYHILGDTFAYAGSSLGTIHKGNFFRDWGETPNLYNGFVFVSERALTKQMLFNLNDGIYKTYDLMTQFVAKRDAWDNSFFRWTTDLFSQYQSIFGVLSSIDNGIGGLNTYFQNILDKLDTLIDNTDEQVHNFWILPLYEFVLTFVPSLDGFSNWIDSIEDFGDEMPSLPIVTVPLIPPNLS